MSTTQKNSRSSLPSLRRRRKNPSAPRGKPGNRGNFLGARASFIDDYYDAYLEAKSGKRKTQRAFWKTFFSEWWKKFHWQLPLDVDPDPSAPPPPPEDANTPQEVLDRKAAVINQTQKVRVILPHPTIPC